MLRQDFPNGVVAVPYQKDPVQFRLNFRMGAADPFGLQVHNGVGLPVQSKVTEVTEHIRQVPAVKPAAVHHLRRHGKPFLPGPLVHFVAEGIHRIHGPGNEVEQDVRAMDPGVKQFRVLIDNLLQVFRQTLRNLEPEPVMSISGRHKHLLVCTCVNQL